MIPFVFCVLKLKNSWGGEQVKPTKLTMVGRMGQQINKLPHLVLDYTR